MKRLLLVCISLMFILCEYPGNKYDPSSPAYVAPTISIVNEKTTIDDTLLTDSVMIALKNNAEKNIYYRWKLDSLIWSGWSGYGDELYTINIRQLKAGHHTIAIMATYDPSNDAVVDSSISFILLPAPEIKAVSDTLKKALPAARCTLWVKAEGGDSLTYAWYADTVKISGATNDTLIIDSISQAKAITYRCMVSNKRSTVTSPQFRISLLIHILYSGNKNTGGTIPVDSTVYTEGALATLKSNDGNLICKNHVFKGWSLKADSVDTVYTTGQIIKVGQKDLILYAVWQETNRYSVAYNGNGMNSGIVPDTLKSYHTGDSVTIADNTGNLAKVNYTFTGWNTDSLGVNGKAYTPGSFLIIDSTNVKLYAQWSIVSVKSKSLWDTLVWDTEIWK